MSKKKKPQTSYADDPDKTLVQLLCGSRAWILAVLFFDALAIVLFDDSDVADLHRISMPFWWQIVILFLHIAFTACIFSYHSSVLKYLCLYKATSEVRALGGAERQKRHNRHTGFLTIVGAMAGGALAVSCILPHIFTNRCPDYFFFGFLLAKLALIGAILQLILLIKANADLNFGINEWRDLRRDLRDELPKLSFPRYAQNFDGYTESLIDE